MVGGSARNEGRLKVDPRAVLALVARELKLELARLPRPVAAYVFLTFFQLLANLKAIFGKL